LVHQAARTRRTVAAAKGIGPDCQRIEQFDNPLDMVVAILIVAVIGGISVFGIFVVVPAILRAAIGIAPGAAKDWRERVLFRYQKLCSEAGLPILPGTFAWVFAWFKLRLDPMFRELPEFVDAMPQLGTVLDIGCGYGVAACALLEWRGEAKIFGIDPDPGRVRVARAVFGSRGQAGVGLAPEIELAGFPDRFDAVFVLDVIHFMSDSALDLSLQRIHGGLEEGGHLVIRAIVPPGDGGSWPWKFAKIRRAMTGAFACHRPVEKIREMIARVGFDVEKSQKSGGNPELVWFIARAIRGGAG
jgi:SAM-dependent methyltransferase